MRENSGVQRTPYPSRDRKGALAKCAAGKRSLGSCEEIRPQAGVGKLKHAPPLHANDLPLVGQALSPANQFLHSFLPLRRAPQYREEGN